MVAFDTIIHAPLLPITKLHQLGDVDVWLIETKSVRDEDIHQLKHLLAPTEMERYNRFKHSKSKKEYLTGKLATRYLFSHYHPEFPPESWRFSTSNYGKPFQSEPELHHSLYFNLSHSNGLVAICIGDKCEIGVDIECIYTVIPTRELAEQCFSDDELTTFFRIDPSLRNEYFFKLWTLKEAYIKAKGMGVSLDLKSFSISVDIDSMDNISLTNHNSSHNDSNLWTFKSFTPDPNYKMAIAYR